MSDDSLPPEQPLDPVDPVSQPSKAIASGSGGHSRSGSASSAGLIEQLWGTSLGAGLAAIGYHWFFKLGVAGNGRDYPAINFCTQWRTFTVGDWFYDRLRVVASG